MELHFYQAECGDAGRIRFLGNDNKYHNIFIDSGYRRTFNSYLKPDIQELVNRGETIDLWIISHIHDDHIGGIEQYIKCIESGELKDIVESWMYNSPRILSTKNKTKKNIISIASSIRQGDILSTYLDSIGKESNNDYIHSSSVLNIYGFKIQVLSPFNKKLEALRKKYKISKGVRLERIENESISVPAGTGKNDYQKKLLEFDLSNWKEDDSIENGSSISLLTEFNNERILWLADSHPSDIVMALEERGHTSKNKLACDWVKVAHHGSRGNNSDMLYSLIDCSNYLVSADGENNHNLPSKEAIARILRNTNRDIGRHYKIVFTYDNLTLRRIFKNESEDVYEHLNFSVKYGYVK